MEAPPSKVTGIPTLPVVGAVNDAVGGIFVGGAAVTVMGADVVAVPSIIEAPSPLLDTPAPYNVTVPVVAGAVHMKV